MMPISVSHTYPSVKRNLRIPFAYGIPILLGMSLGDQIKRARTKLGISQSAIAKRFGISRAAVAQWENGTTRPDSDKLVELASILKLSLSEMLEGDNEHQPKPRFEPHSDLISAWELLTQEQRQDYLADIKKQASTNQAILEQLTKPAPTIRVRERELQNKAIPRPAFIKGKKNAQ